MAAKKSKISKSKITNAPTNIDVISTMQVADEIIEKIKIEKSLVLQEALNSSDVDAIYKARNYLAKTNKQVNIETSKSMLVDPMSITLGMGYQDKPLNVSFQMLRNMGKVPIIKSIIQTRIEQVLNFAKPQQDKYSTGFVIRPKKMARTGDGEIKLTRQQENRIAELTEIILNCGVEETDSFRHDGFEIFLRKFLKDSLELDQGVFDIVNTVAGDIHSWQAVDGATFRIADTYFKQTNDEYKARHKDEYVNYNGHDYLPFYSQIYMNRVINEYYPWEVCFAVRNPSTDIYANGYGRSELEDLIQTVTSILNADQYNSNYFKVGSNPKGILRVTGNVNQSRLEEFKVQWQSQMAGVRNAHKLPVIEAEKMDFISTQQSNKDMEYGSYYEFLIKVACAVYKIDPSEIGFPMSGSTENAPMFEGSNEARLTHSRDKGLKPLLRFTEAHINKALLSRIDDDYELAFVGLDVEDAQKELEDLVKKVQNFMTVNECRRKLGLKDIKEEEGGNMILNPILSQMKMMDKQNEAMKEQQQSNESNKYIDDEYGEEEQNENPFTKALNQSIEKLLTV